MNPATDFALKFKPSPISAKKIDCALMAVEPLGHLKVSRFRRLNALKVVSGSLQVNLPM